MSIYINGRFLTKKITGIQRYAMEVIKKIDEQEINEEVILLVPKNIIYDLNFKNIKIKELTFLNGNLWEQITIPFYLFSKKNAKLLNLFNSAPILFPGYVVLHDLAFKVHPDHLTWQFVLWYSFLTRMNIHRYKHIFTDSESTKKEICNYYKLDKSKVTPTYCSAEHIKLIKPDEEILKKLGIKKNEYCFSLGSKSRHKNHKYIEECAKQNPDIKFVISGNSNTRVLKDEEREKLDNLIITGYITDEELVALYKNCACFIFPSLYEGFGIPPLEAITAGCNKILLSDIDVHREVYGDVANYFSLESRDRKEIRKVLDHGKVVENSILDKYSWKNIAAKIINIMEENNE